MGRNLKTMRQAISDISEGAKILKQATNVILFCSTDFAYPSAQNHDAMVAWSRIDQYGRRLKDLEISIYDAVAAIRLRAKPVKVRARTRALWMHDV